MGIGDFWTRYGQEYVEGGSNLALEMGVEIIKTQRPDVACEVVNKFLEPLNSIPPDDQGIVT